MLNWPFAKTVLCFCLCSTGPMALALLVLALARPQAPLPHPLFLLALLAASLLAGLGGAWLFKRHLSRRIDDLIEQCHQMALGEAPVELSALVASQQWGRLAMSIQVLREALVDHFSIYRQFFEAAPDMFLTLTPAGRRILDANQAFCTNLGLLKPEVMGQKVEQFVSLEHGWVEALQQEGGLIKGQIAVGESTIKVEVSISLERGPEGQPWMLGAILRDVTGREMLHGELLKKSTALAKALEEIKDVEDLKDQFLTTLSHELKTPLVALKGFLQIMLQGRMQPADSQEYLDICWRNLIKLETQINNLLDLARLSHAKEQFDMEPVDLALLVRTEAENLRPLTTERQVNVNLEDLPSGPVTVMGHRDKLIQLVDNLLLNAVKYNHTGGKVSVSLSQDQQKTTLKVSDSGMGMDREHLAKIFNRFYRADISGTGRLEGLGIGLSLVQEIVKLHGGDITVHSKPGQGTSFTVVLEAAL